MLFPLEWISEIGPFLDDALLACLVCYFFLLTGGCQKKGDPHQKWFTWIIMATNNKNVYKSYVVLFTYELYV